MDRIVRGPILVVRSDGRCDAIRDGALGIEEDRFVFVGPWAELADRVPQNVPIEQAPGLILPPFIDIHTHASQHPIRGQFTKDVEDAPPQGRLLAGLRRNVFPAEMRCAEEDDCRQVVQGFLDDTRAHGVLGGIAWMTVHPRAAEIALEMLPSTWHVGLVLMNQNCPPELRTDPRTIQAEHHRLALRFGNRLVVTDRFAVVVDSPLRQRAAQWAGELGLRTQTHLNEQQAEKHLVEHQLYPHRASYTEVYLADGLLDHRCILAHCVHMRDDEWPILRDTGSAIAHCPTSNLLLGSGVMNLERALDYGIPLAIATDVGASPTVSMLAEMARFLAVHQHRTSRATPTLALYLSTRAPARIMGIEHELGALEVGYPARYITRPVQLPANDDPNEWIMALVSSEVNKPPMNADQLERGVGIPPMP